MATFGDYGLYYNLLYADKNYAAETAFIVQCLTRNGALPPRLLDLGCGTGRHACEMAQHGIAVTGVDMSPTMLNMGREELRQTQLPTLPKLVQGDARTVRLEQHFDAITSLFHVMSYQNTEEDALAVLATAWEHLAPGGVFLFDFWYGPGVLKERPEARVKVMENDTAQVTRTATPTLYLGSNLVNVHYHISLHDKSTGQNSQFEEDHLMRYWFLPELSWLSRQAGFQVLRHGGWMHDAPAGDDDWGAWMLLEKKYA